MKIGILEDDVAICGLLQEALARRGHVPYIYNNGEDFLKEIVTEEATPTPKPFDVVVIDLRLPAGISGVDALQRVQMFFPDLPIVVISAVSAGNLAFIEEKFPGVKTFRKPFKLRDLVTAIETT